MQYKVSAIVSTYNSEKFIKGCLLDLINQSLYEKNQLEIIVVDSASQENEWEIVREFQTNYKNINYIRTSERETIYAAWNKGIKIAKGEYITNANTDDRHRQAALEIMANELDNNPEIVLVYGDQIITKTPNETFEKCTPVAYFKWPEFDRNILLHLPCIGPQPMWRKSLHDEFGYFNEELKVAGDYEWWLRISEKYNFKHIPELLGLYYWNDFGVEHLNPSICRLETEAIQKYYMEKINYKSNFKKFQKQVIYTKY